MSNQKLLGIFTSYLCAFAVLPTQILALTTVGQKETDAKNIIEVAEYKPPTNMEAPDGTIAGGTRGTKCQQDRNIPGPPLTALMPTLPSNNNWAVAVEANPQFFVFVPKTSARKAEFVLKDEAQKDVYRTNFSISGEAGVIAVSLPKNVASLKVGQNYNWYFTIFCNAKDRSSNPEVNTWTKRGELNSSLAAQIEKAAEGDRSNLYAENGIWHEAVAILAEARRKNPNAPTLAAEWKKLLESAGVKEIGDVPFTLTQIENSPNLTAGSP